MNHTELQKCHSEKQSSACWDACGRSMLVSGYVVPHGVYRDLSITYTQSHILLFTGDYDILNETNYGESRKTAMRQRGLHTDPGCLACGPKPYLDGQEDFVSRFIARVNHIVAPAIPIVNL